VDWIIKADYIGSTFFDASSAAFVLPDLRNRLQQPEPLHNTTLNHITTITGTNTSTAQNERFAGFGMGPEWVKQSSIGNLLAERRAASAAHAAAAADDDDDNDKTNYSAVQHGNNSIGSLKV
jgi:hypothetical protein